jgi:hypothetical protein
MRVNVRPLNVTSVTLGTNEKSGQVRQCRRRRATSTGSKELSQSERSRKISARLRYRFQNNNQKRYLRRNFRDLSDYDSSLRDALGVRKKVFLIANIIDFDSNLHT